MTGGAKTHIKSYPQFTFLIVMVVLMALIIIDISLIRVYDFVSKLFIPAHIREGMFVLISISSLAAIYILLELIRPSQDTHERISKLHIRWIYRITKLTQYGLGAIVIYTIAQISLYSLYTTINLIVIISCSYLLSVGILGMFIGRMLGLLTIDRNKIVLFLVVVAIGSVLANIVITLINVSLRLDDRPSEIRLFLAASTDVSKGRLNTLDTLYFLSYLLSFVTAWVATATLLRHYSIKIGKLKYWLMVMAPMIFFLSQFMPWYASLLFPSFDIDPFLMASLVTVIATISKPLAGVMLGLGFWAMAGVVKKDSAIRRYLIFAGFGFFMLFTSNQALLMSVAPYPPFGLVTVTTVGVSAYLVLVGLYTSTIYISQDTELRRSIRYLAASQSSLFDSMALAQSAKEIEEKVLEILKKQSLEMEYKSGIETSLNEREAKEYLREVIEELNKGRT